MKIKHLPWMALGTLSLAMTAMAPASAQEKSVAVTAIVEHPALDAVRDGVQAALKEAGYESGKNLKWQYQSAQGNTGTAAQIARKFVGDKPDAIVAIATPSAKAVVAAMLHDKVVPGIPVSRWYSGKDMENVLLVACTEQTKPSQIEQLAAFLGGNL